MLDVSFKNDLEYEYQYTNSLFEDHHIAVS